MLHLLDAIEAGAHFLVRLKAQHDPKLLRVHVGRGERVLALSRLLELSMQQKAGAPDPCASG